MQRDVSIGNVLKLKQPLQVPNMPAFSIQSALDFDTAIQSGKGGSPKGKGRDTVGQNIISDKVKELEKINTEENAADIKQNVQDTTAVAKGLKASMEKLVLPDECVAIISDGDLAAYIPTYFSQAHNAGALSGTIEFMSPGLYEAVELQTEYLHSPVDDAYSYFYVALWATVWNKHYKLNRTKREERWRDAVKDADRRATVVGEIQNLNPSRTMDDYSPIFRGMLNVFQSWRSRLAARAGEMEEALESHKKMDNPLLLLCFDHYAYRCVLD